MGWWLACKSFNAQGPVSWLLAVEQLPFEMNGWQAILNNLPTFGLAKMITVHYFTFNPFQENTYILHDETEECIIIDAGCYFEQEQKELAGYIAAGKLKPVLLLNTHCHLDHVFGNRFVFEQFGLNPVLNAKELPVLHDVPGRAAMWGVPCEASPEPEKFLEEGGIVNFGISELKVFFTPGHSPGSITFYNEQQNFVISGDVLFRESIGRTDLPGGSFETLANSIHTKLFVLPDETLVYSGHGIPTTVGHEKLHNPFL